VTLAVAILLLLASVLVGMLIESTRKRRRDAATPAREPGPTHAGRSVEMDCNVAVHEAGHGVTAWACTMVKTIDRIDIDVVDSEDTAGRHEHSDLRLTADAALWCDVVIKLSGLAAEVMMYGKMKTWTASSDLLQARGLVRQLVARGSLEPPWSTSTESNILPFDRMYDPPLSDEELRIIGHAYRMARTVVSTHRERHGRLVGALLYKRQMTSADVQAVLGHRPFYVLNIVSTIIRNKGEPGAWFYMPKPPKSTSGEVDSPAA
jgi:ATP-dependent Zn protease